MKISPAPDRRLQRLSVYYYSSYLEYLVDNRFQLRYNKHIATKEFNMLLNDMHTDWDVKDNDTRPAIATLHTDGGGYWSEVAKAVRITALSLGYVTDEGDYGELCVHFNTDDWLPPRDGLIYTDKQFKAELCAYLDSVGLPGSDVSYSEQGMQGDNMVSFDAGEAFMTAWKNSKFAA